MAEKRRVKIRVGHRPKKWKVTLLIFVAIAAGILLVFFAFSQLDFTLRQ